MDVTAKGCHLQRLRETIKGLSSYGENNMCGDFEYELKWELKCDVCGKKPAIDLREPDTGESLDEHKALCEKCGIEIYGEDIVSDWAGTELYLKKYPDQVEVWR